MHVKSLVSALALAAAMSIAGPAYAQTMFGGAEVSADDLPALQERCDALQVASTTESLSESEPAEEAADAPTGEDAPDDSDSDNAPVDATVESAPVDELANATAGIDLETVTLEACVEAGLVTAM